MGDTIRCDECGAAARAADKGPGRDRFCTYCGAAFRAVEAPPPVLVQESRKDERERRFDELRAHPAAKRALRSAPSAAPVVAKHGSGLVFLFIALGVAAVIAKFQCSVANEVQHGFQGFGGEMPSGFPVGGGFDREPLEPGSSFFSLFKLVPLLVIGGIIFQIIRSSSRTARVVGSPTRSWLALVLDESTETRGHGDSSRTVAVLTLERENGERTTSEVNHRLARQVSREDMGVAHSRGGEIIGFTRVDV
ncbi:MAG: hypothetical protein ACJAZN_000180 [Planctomycetota bacterium]|jgi:hypothetical protein